MIENKVFEEIAEKFGTPTYVYDESEIRQSCRNFFRVFTYEPKSFVYAMKANSNPAILEIIKEEGFGIDAVSCGDIALSLRMGFKPEQIIFTGVNLAEGEVSWAVDRGVILNIGSLSLLEKVGKKYPGLSIFVRINTGKGAGHHKGCITSSTDSKFGIWHSEIDRIQNIVQKFNLKIIGIHHHGGSQILDGELILNLFDIFLGSAIQFQGLEHLDFGGGFGIPYRPGEKSLDIFDLGYKISWRFERFCVKEYGRRLTLWFEPGRYLVGKSGYLLARVTRKDIGPEDRIFIGVDTSLSHLIRPALYGSYHHIFNTSNPNGSCDIADIGGNVCENTDRFAEQRSINKCKEGDLLVICDVGAYGFSMSSNYNNQPKPAEVLVTVENELKLIRPREELLNLPDMKLAQWWKKQ